MAEFNQAITTNAGLALLTSAIASGDMIQFTKVVTSPNIYPSSQISELTELANIKQEELISSITKESDTQIKLQSIVTNEKVTEDYTVTSIGIYAKSMEMLEDEESEDILYAVASVNSAEKGAYMPAFNNITIGGIELNVLVNVTDANTISLIISPGAVVTEERLQQVLQNLSVATPQDISNLQAQINEIRTNLTNVTTQLNIHKSLTIVGQTGVHGLRYYDDEFQVFNPESGEWEEVSSGVGKLAPLDVSNIKMKEGNGKLTISWSDPDNTIVEGQVLCTWKGTKLVQKAGSYPENAKDGTLLLDNQERNKYATNGFEISGLTNGQTYYFQLFPYSTENAININPVNRISGVPQAYRTMTAVIDLSNSNPGTCVSYADDAVGMSAKSSDWDDFFGHYPVLFKNGVEVGKLKKTNFNQFEDGTTADISSGNAGDAMIAFPRRGLNIITTGNQIRISMTDNPDDANFNYYAHTRGTTRKEVFYKGAFKGYNLSGKLRSLSGKAPTASQTIGTFRTYAKANGTGYDQSGFYQLVFNQAMYILKYKNLNSQSALGRGYVDGNSAAINTGGTVTKGMDFGETTGKQQMKIFGLEDFWGNLYEWIDGLFCNSSRQILTATDNFNDTGSGYTNRGQGATANLSGYMSKPQGSSETGFIVKEASGSATTYFSDYAYLYAGALPYFGGAWNYGVYAGAFLLCVNHSSSKPDALIGRALDVFII